jgi:hypothetical protein
MNRLLVGAICGMLTVPLVAAGGPNSQGRQEPADPEQHGGIADPRIRFAGSGERRPSASEDVGNVAVIVDNWRIIQSTGPFDLATPPVTLHFRPAGVDAEGKHRFEVSVDAGGLHPSEPRGERLVFGFPGSHAPLDDDTQEVPFAPGFPFMDRTYHSVWVNTDGNIGLGAPGRLATFRNVDFLVNGPPRIAGLFADLNPGQGGAVYARSDAARLDVTWQDVPQFGRPDSRNTLRISLFADGRVDVVLERVDVEDQPDDHAVTGIAEGSGEGPITYADYARLKRGSEFSAGAILEEFSAEQSDQVDMAELAQEFYRSHADRYDFLVVFSDFPIYNPITGFSYRVQNHTRGMGLFISGQPEWDFSAFFGSGGELEEALFMNRVGMQWQEPQQLVDPPIIHENLDLSEFGAGFRQPPGERPYVRSRFTGPLHDDFGWQTGNGRRLRGFPRLSSAMSFMGEEVGHRWLASARFVHPTTGIGPDSFDLLGRDFAHWSFFFNARVPDGQFPGEPRSSSLEGNAIADLGPSAFGMVAPPGERFFLTEREELTDGWTALDQYLAGFRRDHEVGPLWYVDDPKDPYTGFPNAFFQRNFPAVSGRFFRGTRVDLTIGDIQAHPQMGSRFWGPPGDLTVRHDDAGRVTPDGARSIVLSQADRELGDEADAIVNGKPVDVKTMAFILLVRDGPPNAPAHAAAIRQVDNIRRTWEWYGNGPAMGGRGRFDTRLNPAIH